MARIENLMLANHAESVNGLLYVHGGGWSHHWRGAEPKGASQFAVAATVLLDQGEGPGGVPFAILVRSSTGEEVMRAEGVLQGPAAPDGQSVRTGVAVNANVVFPREGEYTLSAEIAGATGPSIVFWVHDRAPNQRGPEPDSGGTAGYL